MKLPILLVLGLYFTLSAFSCEQIGDTCQLEDLCPIEELGCPSLSVDSLIYDKKFQKFDYLSWKKTHPTSQNAQFILVGSTEKNNFKIVLTTDPLDSEGTVIFRQSQDELEKQKKRPLREIRKQILKQFENLNLSQDIGYSANFLSAMNTRIRAYVD